LAVVLLVISGLLLHSFARLLRVDGGYDPDRVLLAQVSLSQELSQEAFQSRLGPWLEELRHTAGVEAAGAGNMAPFSKQTVLSQFTLPGPQGEDVKTRAATYVVTPGYAEALSLRIRRGRGFTADDLASGARKILVNQEFARLYLQDGRPVVGRLLKGLGSGPPEETEIIGVVANHLKDGLDGRPQSALFALPIHGYQLTTDFYLLLKSTGDPLALVPTLRAKVALLDPQAAIEAAAMTSHVSASLAPPRFAASALATFALLALCLAATGLYGVLSHNVSQRTREMGIRSALGASRGAIIGLILRQGLAVTAMGLILGMAAAVLATRWLESLLFGVTPLDPLAFGAAPLLLFAVAVIACLLPARRASATDPTAALRCD